MADEDKKTTEETKTESTETPVEETPKEVENKEETTEETPAGDESTDTEQTEVVSAEATEAGAIDEENTDTAKDVETVETEEVKPEDVKQKIDTGMVVRVHVKIKDVTPRGEERERIQIFEGLVINKGGQDDISSTITVRKISGGIGVERIFPVNMPTIDKIEIVKRYRTRRSKLYFLREKYKKRLKEIPIFRKNK